MKMKTGQFTSYLTEDCFLFIPLISIILSVEETDWKCGLCSSLYLSLYIGNWIFTKKKKKKKLKSHSSHLPKSHWAWLTNTLTQDHRLVLVGRDYKVLQVPTTKHIIFQIEPPVDARSAFNLSVILIIMLTVAGTGSWIHSYFLSSVAWKIFLSFFFLFCSPFNSLAWKQRRSPHIGILNCFLLICFQFQ